MPITVRTPAGEEFYKQPIGTVVYKDTGRVAAQTPSNFRHPDTGHAMGKSEIGDTFEELFRQKGAHFLEDKFHQPYSPIAHAKTDSGSLGSRTTPLDFRLNGKFGGELKTLNINAKNQKTAIKKEELERKYRALIKDGLSPVLAVQIIDMENGLAHVYSWPDFASKRVTSMEHLGTYHFSPKDFQRAQEATGHWEKRHERATQGVGPATRRPARSRRRG